MPSTKDKTVGFFGNIEAEVRSDKPNLLPTTRSEGAPKDNKWLVQFVEDGVEIQHGKETSKHPGHPRVTYALSIIEPVEYAGRRVFGMFWYSPEPTDDMDDDAIETIRKSQREFAGDIDQILGDNAHKEVVGDDLEETMENLCQTLDSIICVAKIGKEKEKDGFPAKNKVYNFYPGDSWVGEDEEDDS